VTGQIVFPLQRKAFPYLRKTTSIAKKMLACKLDFKFIWCCKTILSMEK